MTDIISRVDLIIERLTLLITYWLVLEALSRDTALLLGTCWRARLLEVKKESLLWVSWERGHCIHFSICLRCRTQIRWGLLKVLVGNYLSIFVFNLSHCCLNVFICWVQRKISSFSHSGVRMFGFVSEEGMNKVSKFKNSLKLLSSYLE